MLPVVDNKAHHRGVVVGLVSAEEAQIVSGLREGEKVVVKGQDELPDGATVTVEEPSPPATGPTKAPAGSPPPAPAARPSAHP